MPQFDLRRCEDGQGSHQWHLTAIDPQGFGLVPFFLTDAELIDLYFEIEEEAEGLAFRPASERCTFEVLGLRCIEPYGHEGVHHLETAEEARREREFTRAVPKPAPSLDEVFALVHAANLSKFDGETSRREDGKVLKGPNYRAAEPYIQHLLLERLRQ